MRRLAPLLLAATAQAAVPPDAPPRLELEITGARACLDRATVTLRLTNREDAPIWLVLDDRLPPPAGPRHLGAADVEVRIVPSPCEARPGWSSYSGDRELAPCEVDEHAWSPPRDVLGDGTAIEHLAPGASVERVVEAPVLHQGTGWTVEVVGHAWARRTPDDANREVPLAARRELRVDAVGASCHEARP